MFSQLRLQENFQDNCPILLDIGTAQNNELRNKLDKNQVLESSMSIWSNVLSNQILSVYSSNSFSIYLMYSFVFFRDKIERSALDGRYREVIVDSTVHPFGLTLFEHHIYWTDWRLSKLNRKSRTRKGDLQKHT